MFLKLAFDFAPVLEGFGEGFGALGGYCGKGWAGFGESSDMFQKGFQKCARHGPTLPKPTEIRSELILAHAYLSVILRSPPGWDLARYCSIFSYTTAATSHFDRPFTPQTLLRSAPHFGNARFGRLPIFDFSTPTWPNPPQTSQNPLARYSSNFSYATAATSHFERPFTLQTLL